MIVSSFLEQYGIRLHEEYETISLEEFNQLLTGISPDTALGIVTVIAEKNKDIIKNMSGYEKKIRKEWNLYKMKKKNKTQEKIQLDKAMDFLRMAFG